MRRGRDFAESESPPPDPGPPAVGGRSSKGATARPRVRAPPAARAAAGEQRARSPSPPVGSYGVEGRARQPGPAAPFLGRPILDGDLRGGRGDAIS